MAIDVKPSRNGDESFTAQGAKLTEEEQKTVARLFSDPTYFPTEFRVWIKSFIESSGITLPASSIIGGGTGDRTGLVAGCIVLWPGATLPPDCLSCDGQVVSRADYSELFQVLGTIWGAGDGSTTFNLPDYRDRALYGIGGKIGLGAAGTDGVAYGSRGGPDHHHLISGWTSSGGAHVHNVSGQAQDGGYHDHGLDGQTGQYFNLNTGTQADVRAYLEPRGNPRTQAGGTHQHNVSGNTDSRGDHQHSFNAQSTGGFLQNRPSYAGIRICVATGKAT